MHGVFDAVLRKIIPGVRNEYVFLLLLLFFFVVVVVVVVFLSAHSVRKCITVCQGSHLSKPAR